VFVELAGGLALLLGYRTRAIAAVLALFSLVTAAVFHNALGDQNQFIHFFKNIAMAGGLLHVVAFGGGRISLDARRG
jgi:putative oxidoreductase